MWDANCTKVRQTKKDPRSKCPSQNHVESVGGDDESVGNNDGEDINDDDNWQLWKNNNRLEVSVVVGPVGIIDTSTLCHSIIECIRQQEQQQQ